MTRLAQALLILLVAGYPFAVYFGLQYLSLGYLLALLLAVAGLRLLLMSPQKKGAGAAALAMILAVLAAASWLRGDSQGLLWYPVLCNLTMFGIFAHSLYFQSQTAIERLARLREPDLPEQGVRYTRKVTRVWCGFFLLNGAIATFTVIAGDLDTWTLYNGLISYLLMGVLLAAELLVRRRVRHNAPHRAT